MCNYTTINKDALSEKPAKVGALVRLPCLSALHCFVSAGSLNAAVSCGEEIMSQSHSGLGSLRRVLMSFRRQDTDYHTAFGPQLTRVAICLRRSERSQVKPCCREVIVCIKHTAPDCAHPQILSILVPPFSYVYG